MYESFKHEDENSIKGTPSQKVDADAVEEISQALKSVLANPILTANKGKKQL
jgi:hypothetical protein